MTDITTPDATDARLQAAAQYDEILDLLAAVELDWDRLEELREERAAFVIEAPDGTETPAPQAWADQNPGDAEELADLEKAAGDCEDEDDARSRALDNSLFVEVRSGWESAGCEDLAASEFRILLCTGGPAVQIVGDLDANRQPERARLMYQDWFTPWTEFIPARSSVLVQYAALFYFGE